MYHYIHSPLKHNSNNTLLKHIFVKDNISPISISILTRQNDSIVSCFLLHILHHIPSYSTDSHHQIDNENNSQRFLIFMNRLEELLLNQIYHYATHTNNIVQSEILLTIIQPSQYETIRTTDSIVH